MADTKTGTTGARGMGRGLAAILSSGAREEAGLREIPVDLIAPNPDQPRHQFDQDALSSLSDSIAARGILQPLVVRPKSDASYELVAGERRLRAAKLAGLDQVPAVVRETGEDERLELALVENMAREDLNPLEEARALATLVDDLGLSKEEVARRVGRSRVAVTNMIRMLELPDEALAMLSAGELTGGHGRALLLAKDQSTRLRLARAARAECWSVRQLEEHARRAQDSRSRGRAKRVVMHPDLEESLSSAADALSAALGREVRVRPRGSAYRVEFDVSDPREAIALAEAALRSRPAA